MYRLMAGIALSFFAFILWIIYLANTDGSSIFFDFVRSMPYGDKVGHAGLFGFLTFIVITGSKFRSFKCLKLRVYYGLALVTLFVVGEELSQAFIPSRTFDLYDLAADFVGISLATLFAYMVSQYLRKSPNKGVA